MNVNNNDVLRRPNSQANIRNVSFQAGKKVALTLFPPPDKPATNAETIASRVGVPEVQLEQVEEDVETSVLLPPYIKAGVRNQLVRAWKELVSGQAFTGSYLEFYGQRWVYADKVSAVYDCERDIQRTYAGETFQNVFLNKNGWMQGTKRQIFLKSKFSLTDVNSIPGWRELKQSAKGSDDVEPDILICIPPTVRNSGIIIQRPTVCIVEMKIGLGKTESVPEHHQLCRTKRTVEKWLDDFEKTIRNGRNVMYSGWTRPDVRLVFVGWAAPTPDKVVFKIPGRTIGRSGVPVPYVNQNSGNVSIGYQVLKTNSIGFGHLSGVRAAFVSKIIEELNFKRARAFNEVFSRLTNTRTNLGQQVAHNREEWLRRYGAETGPSLRSQVLITPLMKKKKSPTATGVIQRLSNTINMELAQGRNLNAAIGRMLQNASTYNPAVVNSVIQQLRETDATRNNWLSLRNYIMANNAKRTARATGTLGALQRAGVNQGIIRNIIRNSNAVSQATRQVPEAVKAAKRRR